MAQMKNNVPIVGTMVLFVLQKVLSNLFISWVFSHNLAVVLIFIQNHDMVAKSLNLIQGTFRTLSKKRLCNQGIKYLTAGRKTARLFNVV